MAERPGRELHRPDEFRAAFEALAPTKVDRMVRTAKALARKTGTDGDDIFQSAVERVLDGRRPWPRDEDLTAFMTGVMRSLVSAGAEHASRAEVRRPVSLVDADGALAVEPTDPAPTAEVALIAQERCTRIQQDLWNLCCGDDAAALILLGLQDGRDGEQLRLETGLSKKDSDSKRRWVRRCINAYLDGRTEE